jgi:hypothetical protein
MMKRALYRNDLFDLAVALLLPLFFSGHLQAADVIEASRFISPATCAGCHSDIHSQWENSTHNLAHKDPIYNAVAAFFLKDLTEAGEIEEAEACVKCHTPVGVAAGNPRKTSDDLTRVPEIAALGVQCDFCHSATGATRMYNNGIILSPGHGEDDPGVKRGPRKDAEPEFHTAAYSEFHVNPGICGTCHNVRHVAFHTDLETTYDEWAAGPYNDRDPAKRVTCQGCHMYQRPGVPATGSTPRPENPGLASDIGPERPHVFTHNFVGANNFLPGLFEGQDKVKMAEERLKNAATLSIDTGDVQNNILTVTITNTGAGHKLPTGLSNVRQLWLDVTVTDKNSGRVIYTAGHPDASGYLAENVLFYQTVFGDGQGRPVDNLAKAREVLSDNRIAPKKSASQLFRLPPDTPDTGLIVTARLCYRICSQRLIDQITSKGTYVLPITTMAEVQKSL